MSSVKLLITGKNPEGYIKRYILNKVEYTKYKIIDRYNITININYDDYIKLSKVKTMYELKVLKYYGLVNYINLFRNNISFFVCFFISVISIVVLSNICFDIDIMHNNKDIQNIIDHELTSNKIRMFYLIPNYDERRRIINKIVSNNKNKIEWMEIEKRGSKLIIKVTERKTIDNNNEIVNRNIVARKEGIIKKITASQGQILKKENDYVNKGDIIISGNITKDDVIKMQVPAIGKAYAEVWYRVRVKQPTLEKKIILKNKFRNKIEVKLFNKVLFGAKDKSYITISKIRIFDNKVFPFSIYLKKYQYAKIIYDNVDLSRLKERAIKISSDRIRKTLDSDEYIINKKILSFNVKDSKIVIDVFINVYENITEYQNLQ